MPQQAPARNERPANHQPQRIASASDGRARLKARRRMSKPMVTTMDGKRRREFQEVDLAPVHGGDHRPQHEGEIARLRRALEQAPDQPGADEGFLAGRQRRRCGLGGRLSRRWDRSPLECAGAAQRLPSLSVADQRMVVSCHEAQPFAAASVSECIKKPLLSLRNRALCLN